MKRIVNKSGPAIIHMNREYTQPNLRRKPVGLWYSIDFEWIEWLKQAGYTPGTTNVSIDVDESRMYIITNLDDLDAFQAIYESTDPAKAQFSFIDWEAVAKDWAGVEIRNFQELNKAILNKWDLFAKFPWVSQLDCSSGCIWDLSIINSFESVEPPTTTANDIPDYTELIYE